MIRGLFCILLLFYGSFLYGQQNPKEEQAKFITRFPFKQLTGGVVLIHAKFNNIEQPLNFILDSGSGAISIDSSTVEEFNICLLYTSPKPTRRTPISYAVF